MQANTLARQSVEGIFAAAERSIVSREQRRKDGTGFRDAIAEEVVGTARAVTQTRTRHVILRCTHTHTHTHTHIHQHRIPNLNSKGERRQANFREENDSTTTQKNGISHNTKYNKTQINTKVLS